MTMAHGMTLREARDLYLADAGLSTDTYLDDWVDVRLGPLPLRLPSTAARKRVLPLHDLHHALTGYRADILGEAEIGAWELGSGLGRHTVGYVLDLLTLAWSPPVAPRRVWRAFVRGRHSRNFYRAPLPLDPALLERDVDDVRRSLDLDGPAPRANARDALAFAGWWALALAVGVLGLLALPLMLALGLWGVLLARRASPSPV
ncbi:MAG: hypothetical protein KDK70_42790 [Myxococcales bacterium]|nr:hypothetical protein [Myxococcales bacterium]